MLDLYDAKTLISAYSYIERTCDAINDFIYKHAVNFGPNPETTTTYDVLNNIINLMERKNRLINLKNIIDEVVAGMSQTNKQIIILKMRYMPSIKTIQKVLNISSERTAFRRITEAVNSFLRHLNNSNKLQKVEDIIMSENWIVKIKQSMQASVSV